MYLEENDMSKIYERDTQAKCRQQQKNNKYTRKRDVVANFRVSDTEKKRIDARIQLSGLTRSEYFIESCLYQAVLVKGNIRTFDHINKKMEEIEHKISATPNLEDMDSELVESWRVILEMLDKLYGKKKSASN